MLAYTISASGKKVTIGCSDGRTIETDDWMDATGFLLEPIPSDDYNLVWDVNNLADSLFALLPAAVKKEVFSGGKIYFEGRKFYYMPNKLVGINQLNFYALEKYADNEPQDAKALLILAKNAINLGYMPIIHKKPVKMTSMIAAYDAIDDLQFPVAGGKGMDTGIKVNLWEATQGKSQVMIDAITAVDQPPDWRDTYQIGHWNGNEITNYDITNCYPSLIQELPDLTRAEFFESDTMPDKYTWGEVKGTITVTAPYSPFYCSETKGYPNGTFPISMSTDLLWLLERFELGYFRLEHGNFFTLPADCRKPFEFTMKCLYNARNINPMAARVSKGIAVGIGGKFSENRKDSVQGSNYNPIYSRIIKQRATARVATFIYYQHLTPISVLVDGVLAEERINLSTKHESGKWRISDENSPALVVSDQNQWIGSKRPAGIDYATLINLVLSQPDKNTYANGTIDLNALQPARKYEKLPTTGKELLENKYKSTPDKI